MPRTKINDKSSTSLITIRIPKTLEAKLRAYTIRMTQAAREAGSDWNRNLSCKALLSRALETSEELSPSDARQVLIAANLHQLLEAAFAKFDKEYPLSPEDTLSVVGMAHALAEKQHSEMTDQTARLIEDIAARTVTAPASQRAN